MIFELGARAHPPRSCTAPTSSRARVRRHLLAAVRLDRARRGDLRPRGQYLLASREMPKLIYVKQPAEREERLAGLLTQIRDDDTTSYKGLLERRGARRSSSRADLAILLPERFDASRAPPSRRAANSTLAMPRITSPCRPARCSAARPTSGTLLEWLRRRRPAGWSRSSAPRHRQDPPRDRGRAPRTRAVRPGDVRRPRARRAIPPRAARRRAGARRARRRRADDRAAHDRAPRANRPPPARQLRAGHRRRPRRRITAHALPDATSS